MQREDTPTLTVSDIDEIDRWREGTDDAHSDAKHDLSQASAKNPSILLELDMDGKVMHLSKSWESIVGTKIQKIVKAPMSKFICGTEDDKKVFTDAISIMMTDDTSYRVRFVVNTNDALQENSDDEIDNDDVNSNNGYGMDFEGSSPLGTDSASLSSLSTNGGIIELEGQGILIHSPSGIPTHSMWILKPFYGNVMNIQLPTKLGENLGFGVDIFTSYLQLLTDNAIINEEDVPPPPQVLCRICEQQVPSWWLEKHAELCLNEHKCESDVQIIHDSLVEQKKNVNAITESLNKQMYNISDGVTEYKGLPLPKVTQQSDSSTSTPLKRGRSGSLFGTLRFPFKTLALLSDFLEYAININPSEFQEELNTFEFSPNTKDALNHISSAKIPESSDPAINLLSTDTEILVQNKVDAVQRMKNSMIYSQKIKAEVDELILLSITETVKNIRNQTYEIVPHSSSTEASSTKGNSVSANPSIMQYPTPTAAQSNIFTDAYLQDDILPNISSHRSPLTDAQGRFSPSRSITPGESSSKESRMEDESGKEHVQSSEIFKNFHDMNLKSPVLTPVRRPSPGVPPNFHNSPMSSIQRNHIRANSGLDSFSATPVSSPVILANDLSDFYEKKGNITGHEHLLSVSSQSSTVNRPPLSPLLVAMQPPPKPVVPSIKDYEILKPISKGAFGSVYLARRKVTGDYFAIKVLRKSDMIAKNQVTNVKAERAIMMAQSESPYVARLYSSFQSKDNLFLVMEYLSGGDCSTLVKMLGSLPNEWAQRYIAQVIVGVEDLHKKGIVHHDLKPDNLLIDSTGHLKLTDFGLSRMGLVRRQEGRSEKNRSISGEEVLNQMSGSGSSSRHHQRRDSITALSLSGPGPNDYSSVTSSPSSNYFDSIIKDRSNSNTHRGLRSDSQGSIPGSPMLKPLQRSDSQTSFSMPDEDQLSSNSSIKNLVLFDPENSSKNKKFVGTPDYLAPETISGTGESETADWWSVGCILFEFLFGRPPFHAPTPELVFQNILRGEIDWPDFTPEEEAIICSPEAKDLIKKLLVMNPDERLGNNGAEEIKSHPYFKGIDWETLWLVEGSFVPVIEHPESTEYFERRGAEMNDFLMDDCESDEEQSEKIFVKPTVTPKPPNNTPPITTIVSASNSPTQKHLSLAIPLHMRERRPSKLNDHMGEFGSFQFRNLPALDKANKDVINRIKAEHLEQRNSISSSSSESGYSRTTRNFSVSTPTSAIKRSSSPSASFRRSQSPNRGSFSSGNFMISQTPTGVPYDDYHSYFETSGRSSPSTDSGSPSTSGFGKPSTPTPQQISHGVSRQGSRGSRGSILHRKFGEFSPASSDTEDSKSHALERVRKRRQSSKMSEGSYRPSILDVLLCEPIPIVRYQLKKDLESIGCAVVAVAAGDELIRRCTGEVKFDIILTALKIRGLDTIDIVKLLRHTNSVNSDTTIIAVTAYYSEAVTSGMFNDVLEKPVDRRQLEQALRKHCRWKSIQNEEAIMSDTDMVSDGDTSFSSNTLRLKSQSS